MPSMCITCGIEVDALRDPARIRAGRVVTLCRGCAGLPAASAGPATLSCSFCGDDTEAWRAPAVVIDGSLKVRCPACSAVPTGAPLRGRDAAELEVELVVEEAAAVSGTRARPRSWRVIAVGAAVAAAASLYAWVGRGSTLDAAWPRPVAAPPVPRLSPPDLSAAPPRHDEVAAIDPPIPAGVAVHPLPGDERVVPVTATGSFGAGRSGDRPVACGAGHCGIDLRADEGTAVLAARGGVIATVQRDAHGRGGRWLRIDHRGGVATLYFHLDEIREDLEPGARVEAGDMLATLGRSGVLTSPTHLHFAVLVDGAYVDPLPMMAKARVVPATPRRERLAAAAR